MFDQEPLDESLLSRPELDWPEGHRSGYAAVIGAPNVGKSTLINAFVGEKIAIVSSKPQTTRHRLLAILSRPEAQVIFFDTPGLHRPLHDLGEYMVETARDAIADADVILFVADLSHGATGEDRAAAAAVVKPGSRAVALVLNKADLATPEQAEERSREYRTLLTADAVFTISAANGFGLDELLAWVTSQLPEGPRLYPEDQVTDREERFLVAELIREQALLHLRKEVPHAIAVSVDEFQERPNGVVHIAATVLVEKESQKGIVIGAGGATLKSINTAARVEIERFLDHPVYLETWVKVRHNWRRDRAQLRGLGFRSRK
ncbi:MAG: GTPase Era [Anaerolineae bacterium]